ncbi:MAG: phosphate propanoyltransferase [Treponema sp.]|nr:phosphate propanoyltransferase [Treponema sp.]
MNEARLKQLIRTAVLVELAKRGLYYIPAAISARHIHLAQEHLEILFGTGARLTPKSELSQHGEFASEQTLEAAGPRGLFKAVRVLGPVRGATQVELSITDTYTLGIKPVVRMSGKIEGTPGCTLRGPAGTVDLPSGVIVAARHVHLSPEQAAVYGLKDGDAVSLKLPPPREGVLGGVVVRVAAGFDLEAHLDTDEANGSGLLCGTILEMASAASIMTAAAPFAGTAVDAALDLVTERDVNKALMSGAGAVYCSAKGFVSPAAADRAKEKGIAIKRLP